MFRNRPMKKGSHLWVWGNGIADTGIILECTDKIIKVKLGNGKVISMINVTGPMTKGLSTEC